jgi:hypothetical protein
LPHVGPQNGDLWSYATAINDAGTTVGYIDRYQSNILVGGVAVRWDPSGAGTQLQSVAPNSGLFTLNHARALNDNGTSVGKVEDYEYYYDETGTIPVLLGSRAVRWDASSTSATLLGNLGNVPSGSANSDAYALNSAGYAVGYVTTGVQDHAVYWSMEALAVDLNTFIDPASGWLLTAAFDISDTGWIAGIGQFDPDGAGGQAAYLRHFLLHVPVTAAIVPGDFNSDGAVDAADYVVWRKGVGIAPTQENYNLWRANFGRTSDGPASNATVPEPAAAWLLVLGAALGCWRCRQLGERVPKLVGCDTRQ